MSIPANIAEGRRQKSENEFVSLISQTITVRKMLYGLLKRLPIEATPNPGARFGTEEKRVALKPPQPTA